MKIVYCIQSTANSGGMERVLSSKVNYWVEKGYDVTVITTDQMNQARFFYFDPRIKFFDLGVNYQANNGKSVWTKIFQFPSKLIKNKRRLGKILHSIKADIVVSMFDNDALVLPLIKDGSKKVLEIHFSKYWREARKRSGLWGLIDKFRTKVDRWLASRFDQFVVLTHEDKKLWSGIDNIDVIYNALPFEATQVSMLQTKRVIAVGRHDYQKNFKDLIDIWSIIADKHPDWTLSIIGDGKLRPQLEQQIKALDLKGKVILEGKSRNIEAWYLDSSIYAMTSIYEGLPMVLLEAQSVGLPIISYACQCGPRDVITDGVDGFIIEEGDKEVFAKKLEEMMNNHDMLLAMGANAKIASKRFAEDKIMEQWTILFDKLLQK